MPPLLSRLCVRGAAVDGRGGACAPTVCRKPTRPNQRVVRRYSVPLSRTQCVPTIFSNVWQAPLHPSLARPTMHPLPIVHLRDAQEIFGSYGEVTSVDLAVDKRVNLPKVKDNATCSPSEMPAIDMFLCLVFADA